MVWLMVHVAWSSSSSSRRSSSFTVTPLFFRHCYSIICLRNGKLLFMLKYGSWWYRGASAVERLAINGNWSTHIGHEFDTQHSNQCYLYAIMLFKILNFAEVESTKKDMKKDEKNERWSKKKRWRNVLQNKEMNKKRSTNRRMKDDDVKWSALIALSDGML